MNNTDKEQDALKDDVYSQANPPREGFTKADQKHMYRLGKVQELKVCPSPTILSQYVNLISKAKLPPPICPKLRSRPHRNMGVLHACQHAGPH